MFSSFCLFLILFIKQTTTITSKESNEYKIVCYYTNWSQYRPSSGKFVPENIDPNLCTHIIYAFAKIDDNFLLSEFEWNDLSTEYLKGNYEKVIGLKKQNKNLKVLLAVGGWTHGSSKFSDMARDNLLRDKFIKYSLRFLIYHSFDGLDLDWEYPANRDTQDRPDDKEYFTLLCRDLKQAFLPFNLTLTAAVSAGSKTIESAYEVNRLHGYLDFINLMSYDYMGAWDNRTGHNSPLYTSDNLADKTLSVDWSIRKWLSMGVPRNKLIVGLPAYGRSFKLKSDFKSCPVHGIPASGPADKGIYTREIGFLSYYEVCDKIQRHRWTYVWSDDQKVPYAYSSDTHEWIGFDDVKSFELKLSYIKENRLGGAMLWSLDLDDASGEFCSQGTFPLLKTINYHLNPNFKSKSTKPNANVNWIHESNEPFKESDFYLNYSHNTSKRNFNIFRIMKNDYEHISIFCQCKKGIHHVRPQADSKYSLMVNCNTNKLVDALSSSEDDTQVKEKNNHESLQIKKQDEFFLLYFSSKASNPCLNLFLVIYYFIVLFVLC